MSQETYMFIATIFTLESFNFNILIFDQEIGLCKPFQFLWSLRNGCFKAHLQNLKTNTFIKSFYPKTTKKSLEMLRKSILKILSRPMNRNLIATIALDSIGLSNIKSITYPTFSNISIVGPD